MTPTDIPSAQDLAATVREHFIESPPTDGYDALDALVARCEEAERERDEARQQATEAEDERVDWQGRFALLEIAVRHALDCKGPYNGTVSEFGGYPALCPKCLEDLTVVLGSNE